LLILPHRSQRNAKRSGSLSVAKSSSLLNEHGFLLFEICCYVCVRARLVTELLHVNGCVTALGEPSTKAGRELRVDEEFHPAAKRAGSSAIEAA
jgi:hypothetical protein